METEAFDKKFDEGRSVMDTLDVSKSKRSMQKQQRVNVRLIMISSSQDVPFTYLRQKAKH